MSRAGEPVPSLSVVIASLKPGPVIIDCLRALEAQRRDDLELLLVDASSDGTAALVRARFPGVRVLEAPAGTSVPKLRGLGLAASRAPVVGILDPGSLVCDGWVAEAIRVHHARSEPVAGGPVELAATERRSLGGWATYLFDYWEFVPPVPEGPAGVLSGNNLIYKRAALGDVGELRTNGFWKAFVNARLRETGEVFWSSPGLTVQLRRRMPLLGFLRTRFHHGRSYAAMRVEGASRLERYRRGLSAPVLPALFLARQARGLIGKPGARAWFIVSLPLLVAFHLSWAWGELCGYLAGPGRSHDAIRS